MGILGLNSQSENDQSLIEEDRDNRGSDHSVLLSSTSQDSIILANVSTDTRGTPTDPGLNETSFNHQWLHIGEFGLNTVPVWQDYTGEGVRVGVLDDGFNYNHSELSNNYRTDLDFDVLGNDADSLNDSGDNHGTFVSQVIGADDNGTANVGVAFDADLVGIRRGFGSESSTQDTLDAFQYALDTDFDIINNSWGITAAFGDNKNINFTGTDTNDVINKFEDLVEFGRDGLGTNIIFSAGNSRASGSSANYKNYQNSPYSITVGAINEGGTYASFSEAGANLLVTAPGDSLRVSSASDTGAVSIISGTSFSAPAVSGVVALILEANPDLGYRDVQEILAYSSRQIDANGTGWAGEGWQLNGAENFNGGGLHFSHDYGFGLVDALAAVRLAETWNIQQTFTNLTTTDPISSTSSVALPTTGTITTSINVTEDIQIEHVLIDLDISHGRAGDLTVTLISPTGTESVLVYNIDNGAFTTAYGVYNGINFEFSSVAHLGESSFGEWQLRIEDTTAGNGGTLNNWSLSFLGNEQSADDLYIYTNEFGNTPEQESVLSDADGGVDTLNLAAVTTDVTLDLNFGGTVAGRALVFDLGATIENVYSGDGADTLTGNDVDNFIFSGRGDDLLFGSLGNDTLDGAQGTDTISYDYNIGDFVFDLVNDFTVTLTNSVQNFTDTILNTEFFNFNGTNYSRSELNDYVTTQNSAPPVATKLSINGAGGRSSVINKEAGTFLYTGEELGDVGNTSNVLSVTRETTSLDARVLNPRSGDIDFITLRNNDLTDVSVQGVRAVKLIQTTSAQNITANLSEVMTGQVYTGTGADTINLNLADVVASTGLIGWRIDTAAGNDVVHLSGSAADSYTKIYLQDGDDVVTSSVLSRDWVYGGEGNDVVSSGDGDDRLFGQNGDDTLNGEGGNDRLAGGNGADILNGGAGADRLFGEAGDDILRGGSGNDRLTGGDGNDTLYGELGRDLIAGGDGNDTLYGGAENDRLSGGNGADTLYGDDGNDVVYGQAGNDILHGGSGNDLLRGLDDDDTLYGEADNDRLYGENGNDTLFGGDGNDRLYGQNDNDRLSGGEGNDILYGGAGDDVLIGGAGVDIFYNGTGIDTVAFDAIDGNADRLYDFTVGEDVLNITDILQGYDAGIDNLNDYVQLVERSDGSAELRINADGDAGGAYTREAIIYTDFAGQGVNDLLANGTLIADQPV